MESLGFNHALEIVKVLGLPGIIFIIWYFSEKSHERTLTKYREDVAMILAQYKEDMAATRLMYENNVTLVKQYEKLSCDLKDVVLLNAQSFQRLCDLVTGNQFCPMVRLQKEAPGRVMA